MNDRATIFTFCNAQIQRLTDAKEERKKKDDELREKVNRINKLLRERLLELYRKEDSETIKTVEERLTEFYAYEPNRQWAAQSNIPIPDGVLRKKGKKRRKQGLKG